MKTTFPNPPDQPHDPRRGALLRLRIINWLQERLESGGCPLAQALREAASRPWPDAESGQYFAVRTLEDWWYAFRKGGFNALCPQPRSDAGSSRTITEATGRRLIELVGKYPDMPLKVWWLHARQEGEELPPLSTTYRFLRKNGYDRKGLQRGRLQTGATKAFEAARVNDLWMTDFSPGPKIRTRGGELVATQLSVIIDDHSRLIAFAFYAPKADTATFLHTLKEAISRRGLPVKLYTDQGKPFVCEHARIVCANLDIRLLHARPYHAWSKGKVERVIRTIQEQFEARLRLEGEAAGEIDELNDKLWRWIEGEYHQRVHTATGESPLDRYRRAIGSLRELPADVNLDPLFYTRKTRTVRKDGTVLLENVLYEVPLHLRGLRVELRYDPFDLERVEVWHDKRLVKLARRADRVLNSELGGHANYDY